MSRQILAIDQSPCRASYGVLNAGDFLSATVARQKQTVRENIDRIVADGNRLARDGARQDVVVAIAAERYLAQPPKEITIKPIARPRFRLAEITGGSINIFI